jgi:hypothetical protein
MPKLTCRFDGLTPGHADLGRGEVLAVQLEDRAMSGQAAQGPEHKPSSPALPPPVKM